jgi:hypothetical protein
MWHVRCCWLTRSTPTGGLRSRGSFASWQAAWLVRACGGSWCLSTTMTRMREPCGRTSAWPGAGVGEGWGIVPLGAQFNASLTMWLRHLFSPRLRCMQPVCLSCIVSGWDSSPCPRRACGHSPGSCLHSRRRRLRAPDISARTCRCPGRQALRAGRDAVCRHGAAILLRGRARGRLAS